MADCYFIDNTDSNASTVTNWFAADGSTPIGAVPGPSDTAYFDVDFALANGGNYGYPDSGVCGAGTVYIISGANTNMISGVAFSGAVDIDAGSAPSYCIFMGALTNAGVCEYCGGNSGSGADWTNTGTLTSCFKFGSGTLTNTGTVDGSGGIYSTGTFTNTAPGTVADGKFLTSVVGSGGVSGGSFFGGYVGSAAAVTGGTFYGDYSNAGGTTSSAAHVNAAATISNYDSATLVLFDVLRTKVDNSLTGGTLVLPAEADVRSGTDYGVDGDGSTGTAGARPRASYLGV